MSSTPPETTTYELTLSREEAWVVHHLLTTRIEEAIATDELLSAWTLEVLESLEADGLTETLTGPQARRLCDALATYVDGDVPETDVVHGSTVVGRLEDRLEAA